MPDSQIDERARRRFEADWLAGRPQPIERYLRSADDGSLETLEELVLIELEFAWKSARSEHPLVEEYLRRFPQLNQNGIVARLLAQEYEMRWRFGQRPKIDEYLARFPALADELSRFESPKSTRTSRGAAAPEAFDELSTDVRLVETGAYSASPPPDADSPPREPLDAPLVKSIGRYQVIETLGSGSFGVVYKAFDPELKREVAIKSPRSSDDKRPMDADDYLSEAQNVASLDHPRIVPVYDVGRTPEGMCYVVSKYVPGGNLTRRTQDRRPTVRETVEIVAELAEGLHHAHRRGLVHRDVKPQNILLDERGHGLIADFGLALRDSDFGEGERFAGTPAYMSPEQASGAGHLVDPRSDIFSLGAVLYEMLTGKRPFRNKNLRGLLSEIASCDVRSTRLVDDSIPEEVDRICLKAMARSPANRYATASDFARDLRQFLAGPAKMTSLRWAWAGGCVAALVVVVAALWPRQQTQAPKSTPVAAPTAAVSQDSSLTLRINLQRAGERGSYRILKAEDMPLRDGDKVQINVSVAAPMYVYLFWVDAAGKLARLWPADLDHQQKIRDVFSPPEARPGETQLWHLIGGEHGAEMVLAFGSGEPLTAGHIAAMEHTRFQFAEIKTSEMAAHEQARGVVGAVASEKSLAIVHQDDLLRWFGTHCQTSLGVVVTHE